MLDRDTYGVFSLVDTMSNWSPGQTLDEYEELLNLTKVLGLTITKKKASQQKNMRYQKLIILCDQDHKGAHFMGKIIHFFYQNWPNLIKQEFLEQVINCFYFILFKLILGH